MRLAAARARTRCTSAPSAGRNTSQAQEDGGVGEVDHGEAIRVQWSGVRRSMRHESRSSDGDLGTTTSWPATNSTIVPTTMNITYCRKLAGLHRAQRQAEVPGPVGERIDAAVDDPAVADDVDNARASRDTATRSACRIESIMPRSSIVAMKPLIDERRPHEHEVVQLVEPPFVPRQRGTARLS